jgi:hypothetical protein
MFYWFEPVLYLDPVSKFPETIERPGYFVGFADNVGDLLTFKVMKNDLTTVLQRNVVRSAANAKHLNKRVTFKPDIQERLDKLDNDSRIISKNRHPKNRDRDIHNDILTRTRSKIIYPDQNVGVTTRSKMQVTCNLNAKGLLFPLHDFVPLSNSNTNTTDDLQLGTNECKMYHDGLMRLKTQVDFDRLRNLHLLDKNEVGDTSWQCIMTLKYNEDRGAKDGHQRNCLVEWNNVNKTQSCINFSALSLSNPIPIIACVLSEQD